MTETDPQQPADQAIPPGASPISGVAPPAATRWKPGQTGNPKGRPAIGASVREFLNMMQDWTVAEVRQAMRSDLCPVAQRMACRSMIHACSMKMGQGGPIAAGDFKQIIEHTAGKAVQAMTLRAVVNDGPGDDLDMAEFTDDELLKFAAAAARRRSGVGQAGQE